MNILAVDFGGSRIGLAIASKKARLPRPYLVIQNSNQATKDISEIAKKESTDTIVVGLPRNMSGEETAQTMEVRQFTDALKSETNARIVMVDESLSTKRAETAQNDLAGRPPGAPIDDLAACFILEEFLKSEDNGKI